MKNYNDEIVRKLQEIARTVEKLEATLVDYQESDGRIKSYFENKKALHHIHQILNDSDDIADLYDQRLEESNKKAGIVESEQYAALDKINAELLRLDDTLNVLEDNDEKIKSYIAQKKAIHEIKKVLHFQGQYDHFVEDELDNLADLYEF